MDIYFFPSTIWHTLYKSHLYYTIYAIYCVSQKILDLDLSNPLHCWGGGRFCFIQFRSLQLNNKFSAFVVLIHRTAHLINTLYSRYTHQIASCFILFTNLSICGQYLARWNSLTKQITQSHCNEHEHKHVNVHSHHSNRR